MDAFHMKEEEKTKKERKSLLSSSSPLGFCMPNEEELRRS